MQAETNAGSSADLPKVGSPQEIITKPPNGYDLPRLRELMAATPVDESLLRMEWQAQATIAERRYDLMAFKILLSLLDRTGGFFSPATKAMSYRYHGIFHLLKCEYTEAEKYFLIADKFAQQGAPEQIPFILSGLGFVQIQEGKLEEATHTMARGQELAWKADDPGALAAVYDVLSALAYYKGDLRNLLAHAELSLKYATKARDRKVEGSALNSIAAYYLHHQDWDKCFEYFNRSLQVRQEIGDMVGQAETRSNMGAAARYKGDLKDALFQLDCAVAINEQIRHKGGLADSLDNKAHVLILMGRPAEALEQGQRALTLRREAGDNLGEVTSLTKLGLIYRRLGDATRALQHLEAARGLAEEMGDRLSLMKIYTELGEFLLQNSRVNPERHSLALTYIHKAFNLMELMGDRTLLPDAIRRLAESALRCGCDTCTAEALDSYQRLLELVDEKEREGLGQPQAVQGQRAAFNAGLARCWQLRRRPAVALDYFRTALALMENLPDKTLASLNAPLLYCYAARCAYELDSVSEALTWLEIGLPNLQKGREEFEQLKVALASRKDPRKRTTGKLTLPPGMR